MGFYVKIKGGEGFCTKKDIFFQVQLLVIILVVVKIFP